MLDHIILTVSDVKPSLAFYEAALKPLNIKFFMPYKGEDGHPDLWGIGDGRAFFWLKQGKPDPAAIHWGFKANDQKRVARFQEFGELWSDSWSGPDTIHYSCLRATIGSTRIARRAGM